MSKMLDIVMFVSDVLYTIIVYLNSIVTLALKQGGAVR